MLELWHQNITNNSKMCQQNIPTTYWVVGSRDCTTMCWNCQASLKRFGKLASKNLCKTSLHFLLPLILNLAGVSPSCFAVKTGVASWYNVLLFGMRELTLNDEKKSKIYSWDYTKCRMAGLVLHFKGLKGLCNYTWNLKHTGKLGWKAWDPLWRQPVRTVFQRLH